MSDIVGICPKCGKRYGEPPALSRDDNQTLVCPDCGLREALRDFGIPLEKQAEILSLVHKSEGK